MKAAKDDSLLESLFEGLYKVDGDRRIFYWNKAAEAISGYEKSRVVGSRCPEGLLQHVDEQGKMLCGGECPLAKTLQDGQYRENLIYIRHRQGHRVPVEVRVVPLRDDGGQIIGAAEVFRQLGVCRPGQDAKLRELARLAFVDALSGQNNRQYMELKLKEKLSAAAVSAAGSFGVIKLEIANLREIHDDYGEEVSNTALKVAGQTLAANLEPADVCGRWYGGRFMVLTSADRKSTLLNWASKLKSLLEQSSVPGYEEVRLEVNVGGVSQQGEMTAERLLRRLDGQVRQSRQAGGVSIED